jgi:pimeloyl-ACP methyl ester carboxylesterase
MQDGQKQAELNGRPEASGNESLAFCLVHGSWHGAWCWKDLKSDLESRGHTTIAMDVPFDNPDLGMHDYAEQISSLIDDEKNTVLVAHSRMANVVPLVTGNLSLRSAVYLCPGFDPEYNLRFREKFYSRIPRKYQPGFTRGVVPYKDNPTLDIYDAKKARAVFYHDCEPGTAQWAAEMLRPMYRARKEKPVSNWHEVKSTMVYASGDRVINPKYSEYIARALGMEAIELATGHCPFLSQPAELSDLLDDIAQTNGQ